MTEALKISLLQLDLIWENPNENHRLAERILGNQKQDLIVLPEMFSSGFTHDFSETESYPSLLWLQNMARIRDTALFTSIAVSEGETHYNRGFWVTPDAKYQTYDKKHLFNYGKENLRFKPGNHSLQTEYKGWQIKPLICYDLRFPVWSRNIKPYYDLLIYTASWPHTRINHWMALLKARAIENQCYVVGVNRVGTDGYQLQYPGRSAVFDFKGELLLDAGSAEGCYDIELSYRDLKIYREHLPFMEDDDEWVFLK